jgi:hypothetical protein
MFAAVWPSQLHAATWTPLKNLAPVAAGIFIQLTDGTILSHDVNGSATWMRLTPDAHGSYINGTWSTVAPGFPRRAFASNMMPNGKVFVLGGEYSGTAGIANWSAYGDVYDPVANTWTPIAPYPPISNCPIVGLYGGSTTAGSPMVTGMNPPSTAGFQVGWTVSGSGIPANTTILSVDSTSQVTLSNSATLTGDFQLSIATTNAGSTSSGSRIIGGLTSTTGYQVGWTVAGNGIPAGATISSVDSLNQIHISANATATATGVAFAFGVRYQPTTCFGDAPSMLLGNGQILTGSDFSPATYLYNPATNTWSAGGPKNYGDNDEQGWVLLNDGTIVTYDIEKSIAAGAGYAERYNPITNKWSSISPADGTAGGFLPLLSSDAVGEEIGPLLRLQDGRIFVIGANGHTALYDPSINSWSQGPDVLGTLGGNPFLYSADDAVAAILPNGHVIFSADAGIGLSSAGNVTAGSPTMTGIPVAVTNALQAGWAVTGAGLPAGATILSVGSGQIIMSTNATATTAGESIQFGGPYTPPTQLFDFDPVANTISVVSPPLNNSQLTQNRASLSSMLVLPNGQLLFVDYSTQVWVYTPDGAAPASLLPVVTSVTGDGAGTYTLTGTQLDGQSAGAMYGDDKEMDENYPIVRLVDGSGNVFFAHTFSWSWIGVGPSPAPETVNFALPAGVPSGTYSLLVSGAGLSSNPFPLVVYPNACTFSFNAAGQSLTATGGSVTVSITTTPNCPWNVAQLPSWITVVGASSGTGPGSVTLNIAPNSGADQSASIAIGGTPFIVDQQTPSIPGLSFVGSMPHLAAEGGWLTTFTFVNKSSTAQTARTNLFSPAGSALPLPIALPQQTAINGDVLASSLDQTIAANAQFVMQATGPANVPYFEGSAQLNATGTVAESIDGFAIFHYNPNNQEAVVPMETRNAAAYILPFDNTNGVLTGVALENVSANVATIPVIIRDDTGATVGTGTIALNALGHTSFVLSDAKTGFPVTANIRGTVEFDTPTSAQISVLGIRYTGGTLTTIPVLANVSTSGGLMAHLASGAGWQTTFALVNTGTTAASATLNFYADDGSAQSLPLTVLESGVTSTASTTTQTIGPNSSVWIQSAASATGALLSGSALLTTTGNVSGYAIFRYNPNGQEAVVPLESRNTGTYLIAFDNTNSTTTGVAINSIATQNVSVPVTLRDDQGNLLTTSTIALNANGHTSFLLAQQYPQTAGLRGTAEFDTPGFGTSNAAKISVLGIRSPPALTFTTLPALSK